MQAANKTKKQINAISAPAKYIRSRLNFVLLLLPNTAKVKQLPNSPKTPTTVNNTPSTQNRLVLNNGAENAKIVLVKTMTNGVAPKSVMNAVQWAISQV